MGIWEQISQAVKEGEDPVVVLDYRMLSTVVRPEAPKRRGPAPKEKVVFSLYGKIPMAGRSTYVQRCWNPYCRKRLNGRFVCNDGCKALAKEHLETALNLLGGGVQLPPVASEEIADVPIYDDQGRDRAAASRGGAGTRRDPRGRKPKGYRGPKANVRGRKEVAALFGGKDGEGEETGGH